VAVLRLRHITAALVLATMLALSAGLAAGPAASPAVAVSKGIVDVYLEGAPADSTARAAMVREIGHSLDAEWFRIFANWAALEPTRGEYSAAQLARLDALIGDLHAAGIKVLLTTLSTPTWAQDSYWWSHPPAGFAKGPQGFYPT
jgi:Beta-galactosidase